MKNENPPTELAKRHYWNSLELRVDMLLALVRNVNENSLPENFGEGDDPWTQAVRQAARDAYEKVCPRQTPRQFHAYAAGLKVLRPKPAKTKKSKEPVPV